MLGMIKMWFAKKLANVETSFIPMDSSNRKARIGIGKNDGKWYFRIDAWWVGYRINQK